MKCKSIVSTDTAEIQINGIFFSAQSQTQTESDAKKAHEELYRRIHMVLLKRYIYAVINHSYCMHLICLPYNS